jgi:hypothetical protein
MRVQVAALEIHRQPQLRRLRTQEHESLLLVWPHRIIVWKSNFANQRWNREILRPITTHGNNGVGKVAYSRLGVLLRFGNFPTCAPAQIYIHLFVRSTIMLRRTKVEKVDELGLPPRVMHTRRDLFNDQVVL